MKQKICYILMITKYNRFNHIVWWFRFSGVPYFIFVLISFLSFVNLISLGKNHWKLLYELYIAIDNIIIRQLRTTSNETRCRWFTNETNQCSPWSRTYNSNALLSLEYPRPLDANWPFLNRCHGRNRHRFVAQSVLIRIVRAPAASSRSRRDA